MRSGYKLSVNVHCHCASISQHRYTGQEEFGSSEYCIHLFKRFIEQSTTDFDLIKRICADMNAKFNGTDVFLRTALEVLLVWDNNNDIVQNQDVIQHTT